MCAPAARGQGTGRPAGGLIRPPVEAGGPPRYTKCDMPKWQDVLKNSVSKETVRASNLRRIPHLKACPFWDRAVFMGRITYKTPVANYDGGIVKYD